MHGWQLSLVGDWLAKYLLLNPLEGFPAGSSHMALISPTWIRPTRENASSHVSTSVTVKYKEWITTLPSDKLPPPLLNTLYSPWGAWQPLFFCWLCAQRSLLSPSRVFSAKQTSPSSPTSSSSRSIVSPTSPMSNDQFNRCVTNPLILKITLTTSWTSHMNVSMNISEPETSDST